jgi:glutaminyl-peptide cyclotransferase
MKRMLVLCVGLLLLAACQTPQQAITLLEARFAPVQRLEIEVISVRPHDSESYTQGLLWHNGVFYESAGQYEKSDVRRVDPATGEVLAITPVPPEYFAEGLALVGDFLIQITWQESTAFIYRREGLELVGTFTYSGQGWGLCYDGQWLYMSDGSAYITRRDPTTFVALDQLYVTMEGQPVTKLNELECVGQNIYANVWFEDRIVRIDKQTGVVDADIDAKNLLSPDERLALPSPAVLNGIAYDPEKDVFYITGKLWPKLFEVRFVAKP